MGWVLRELLTDDDFGAFCEAPRHLGERRPAPWVLLLAEENAGGAVVAETALWQPCCVDCIGHFADEMTNGDIAAGCLYP